MYTRFAQVTNPDAAIVAISLNTSSYSDAKGEKLLDKYEERYNLPAFDPLRKDSFKIINDLIDALL